MAKSELVFRYIGEGWRYGIPARDLYEEDMGRLKGRGWPEERIAAELPELYERVEAEPPEIEEIVEEEQDGDTVL